MEFFKIASLDQRKSLLSLLILSLKADDINHYNELKFIQSVGKSLNLSQRDIDSISLDSPDFDFDLPKGEHERMIILLHILHIIKIDGNIIHKEKEIAFKAGLLLALSPLLINDLINCFETEINTGYSYSQKEISEIIQKYLN